MTAKILKPTPENIALLGERLRTGELVAMPTETVYGLAANLFDEGALARVFSVKERPRFDPLICHIASSERRAGQGWLERLAEMGLIDGEAAQEGRYTDAEKLAERFWPGPLTLVLPKASGVSDLATSGLSTLAVRSPRHEAAQALLKAAGVPLCAPSANRFGRISPTSAEDVLEELGDRIEWILDGGACPVGLESTVVGFEEAPVILRRGAATQEEIASVLGRPIEHRRLGEMGSGRVAAPGMLASHYAPRKKLFLISRPISRLTATDLAKVGIPSGAKLGLLVWRGEGEDEAQRWGQLAREGSVNATAETVASLSKSGDAAEAARGLFAALRRLDADSRTTHLVAEPPPSEEGLAGAILDRLQRAAS